MSEGRLLVCATPIGNLGDVTLRVLDALRDADTIAAEDTRVTKRLLARYDIHTPVSRFDAHSSERETLAIVSRIEDGASVALVSDAGTPSISDPGTRLVDACIEAGVKVEVLPGPSAIVAALVASGLPTGAFYFGGFLPRKRSALLSRLADLSTLDATLVFYESPRRTAATLAVIAEVWPTRSAAVVRELTKIHEEIIRGVATSLAEELAERELKGEVVIVVGPPDSDTLNVEIDDRVLAEAVAERMARGESRKDAAQAVAKELGAPKNRAYEASLGRTGRSSA